MRNVTTVYATVCLLIMASATELMAQQLEIDLKSVAKGFASPMTLVEAPDGSGRLFVADQTGQVWIIDDDERLDQPFLDLSDKLVELRPNFDERGLLGFAFHPDYSENGHFYVYYSIPLREGAPDNFDHTNRLSRFTVSPNDANTAAPESERVLLEMDWPYFNHNGGALIFGPDRMLYLSLGDGGNRNDDDRDDIEGHVEDWYDQNPGGNGQDIENNLLGSILRLEVSEDGGTYSIPDDNPFKEVSGVLPVHWAYGFRNPWRMAFDPGGDNALIVGDVGQAAYEEISVVTKGGNYGWNVWEGAHCFNAAEPANPIPTCPDTVGEGHPLAGDPILPPVIELENTNVFENGTGLAVIGGHVFRGDALPPLFEGTYFFGMWSSGRTSEGTLLPGRLFAATMQDEGTWPYEEVVVANADTFPHYVLSFGQDLTGNIYVLTTDEAGPQGSTGRVYLMVESGTVNENVAREHVSELPDRLVLAQNYPNPFNPETTIRFSVPASERVTLRVYDTMGREIVTLLDRTVSPGSHSVIWNATNASGQAVPSGVYVYRATSESSSNTRIMTLLR